MERNNCIFKINNHKNLCGVYNIVPGNYNEHDILKKRESKAHKQL